MAASLEQVRTVFCEAVDRDAAAQAAYLSEACAGKPELRARVEALLRANEAASGFLAEAVGQPPPGSAAPPIREGTGTVIGAYELRELIGEGGFGLVFRAEQREPVRRTVAVKVLKAGMDTREVILRFKAERQALALMEHPNIARVLDAGTTPLGRPYFVMELVRGVPITGFCDEQRLGPRERLHLFLAVCRAVQHAHQKGVIHRDIKPTNVLVMVEDGQAVIKVIDFGIAKALGQSLTDKTLCTGMGQLLGTPLYMSPEQAAGSGDIDTRSDIYSMGVLLYELLTGTTPFDLERLRAAGYDEMRRIIREEEPPRPSTRLSTLGQAATTVSERRHIDPRHLRQLLRGELDWIVMKALEKDRSRRYETAGAFAADVEHFLRDEPVTACPPSAWYRFRKFSRRRRWALTMAAVVGVAVAAITVIATTNAISLNASLIVSEANRQRAGDAEQTARGAAQAAKEAEKTARGAERTAKERQFAALVLQARASRTSGRSGQRFGSLAAVTEALALARELHLPATTIAELRNEVIGALALPDMRIAKEWDGCPDGVNQVDFDDRLERHGWVDHQGQGSIRRVAENAAVCSFRVPAGEWRTFLSPDGKSFAVQNAGSLKLFQCAVPAPRLLLDEKPNWPLSDGCAFSPDSQWLAVYRRDNSIALFNVVSGQRTRTVPMAEKINHIQFHRDSQQLAVATNRGVQILNIHTGVTLAHIGHHLGQASVSTKGPLPGRQITFLHVAWHPGGKILATIAGGLAIDFWDLDRQQSLGRLDATGTGGSGTFNRNVEGGRLAFNRTGDLLATAASDGVLRLWDWRNSKLLFKSHTHMSDPLRFSPDDRGLACEIQGSKLRLWEIDAGREYRTLDRRMGTNPGEVRGLVVHADGRLLTVLEVYGLAAWDLHNSTPIGYSLGDKGATGTWLPLRSIALEPSGDVLTLGDRGLFRWRIRYDPSVAVDAQITSLERLPLAPSDYEMALSADGKVMAVAQRQFGAFVRREDRPGPALVLQPHENDVRHVAVSPDGNLIATSAFNPPGGVKVWDGRTRTVVTDLPVGSDCLAAFSKDGAWLATRVSRKLHVWAVGSWKESKAAGIAGDCLAFAPDNRTLAVETGAGVIRLIDVETGSEDAQLQEPNQERSSSCVFSPRGERLIAISADANTIHVWNLALIRKTLAAMGLDWDTPRAASQE